MDGIIAAIKKRIEECKSMSIVTKSNFLLGEVEVNELIGSRMAMLHDLIERFGDYAPSLHKIT